MKIKNKKCIVCGKQAKSLIWVGGVSEKGNQTVDPICSEHCFRSAWQITASIQRRKKMKTKRLKIDLSFRDIADLIEGLDCLSDVMNRSKAFSERKSTNPNLREHLITLLRKIDKVDAEYYAEYNQ
jgi:hypothetical protein